MFRRFAAPNADSDSSPRRDKMADMFIDSFFAIAWLGGSIVAGVVVGRLYRSVLIGVSFAVTFALAADFALSRAGYVGFHD
jgi:hypothetical protein